MSNDKKKPWDVCDAWKSESQFWGWLRGCLRKAWMRYPPSITWKQAQAIPPPAGYTGRAKKFGVCALCGLSAPISSLETDHIDEGGSIKSYEDAARWLEKILDVNDNWQLVHKECHKIKSYSVKMGITFAQAKLEKDVITFMKRPVTEQKQILTQLGYSDMIISNATKRRNAYREYLKGENIEHQPERTA